MTIHDRSEHIEFSMTFDAPVTVTGDPTFAFDLDADVAGGHLRFRRDDRDHGHRQRGGEGDPVFLFSLTDMGGPANDVPATYDDTRSIPTTIVFTYTVQAGDREKVRET